MVRGCLITGGCGFIGTSLIQKIVQESEPYEIRVLDNLSIGMQNDLGEVCKFQILDNTQESSEGVSLRIGDIRDYETCKQMAMGMDCIVHLAANTGVGFSVDNPRLDLETNITGTFNLLEAARQAGVQQFVFASSAAPAGQVTPPVHEEVAPHPVSPYGASKLAGEGYCSAYAISFGINTVSLRFGNVYGPRSKHKSSVVAKFIRKALAGEVCEIFGDGTQTRDFIYIDDLVDAILLAMNFKGKGEIFQIATGKEITILEVAEILQTELCSHGVQMKIQHSGRRLGDVYRNFADISKAKSILGWEPVMKLKQGIQKTVSRSIQ